MGSHANQGSYPDPIESSGGRQVQGIFNILSNTPNRIEEI